MEELKWHKENIANIENQVEYHNASKYSLSEFVMFEHIWEEQFLPLIKVLH